MWIYFGFGIERGDKMVADQVTDTESNITSNHTLGVDYPTTFLFWFTTTHEFIMVTVFRDTLNG